MAKLGKFERLNENEGMYEYIYKYVIVGDGFDPFTFCVCILIIMLSSHLNQLQGHGETIICHR